MKVIVAIAMAYFAVAILVLQRLERAELMMAFVAGGALGAVVFENLDSGDTSTFWFLPAVALPLTAFFMAALRETRRKGE